jgi:DNA-3-methyladenine glycosylase II
VRRLRGLAEAAIEGRLATERLRALPPTDALAELRGVGEFTAQGILLRGCGLVDELPDDVLSREVIADMYADELSRGTTADEITARWRPYRTWATVLLRVGWGRRAGSGVSYPRAALIPQGGRRPTCSDPLCRRASCLRVG